MSSFLTKNLSLLFSALLWLPYYLHSVFVFVIKGLVFGLWQLANFFLRHQGLYLIANTRDSWVHYFAYQHFIFPL